MSYSEDQLWDLLRAAGEMPYGSARIAAVEQVIGHADAQHLTRLAFEARMHATHAYVYGGEPARSVVTFSWCLAEYDRDPEPYRGWYHTLLWHFKYMVLAMLRVPEVPLDRTLAVLDDMQRRWVEAGCGLEAVYHYRHLVARHVGDLDAAQEWFGRWRTTPRDRLSDCVGCTPGGQARWLAETGHDEEAIRLAEPVLAGRLTCTEQPQAILTTLLLPYLRTGRLDQARDAHRRAYLRLRPNLADLGDIGQHVHFCAVTGNPARAVEIVQRHLSWLDRAPSPFAAMEFAASAALALRRAGATGEPGPVHRAGHGERPAADLPAGELADQLAGEALAIAGRFDARNGTTHQTRRVRELLDAAPVVAELPLSASAPHRAAPAVPPPAPAAAPVPDTAPVPAAAAPPAPASVVPPTGGPDELLDLAEAWYRDDREEEAVAAWHAFDERYAGTELTVRQRARRADGHGIERALRDDPDAAGAAWRTAADLFAQAGDEAGRQRALGRLGLLRCQQGQPDEGLAMVESSTAYLLTQGTPSRRVSALQRLARALGFAGQPARALAVLDEVPAHVDPADVEAHLPVKLALLRAHLLGQSGDAPGARAAAEEAREHSRTAGYHRGLAGAGWLAGLAAEQLGDRQAALAAYDEALAAIEPDQDRFRLVLRTQRAGLLAGSPRAAEAVDDLVEAVARSTADGNRAATARSRHQLAIAYLNSGRPLDAAEVAEEALAWFVAADDPHAAEVRHLLAACYERLDQPDQAIVQLDAAAADCSRRGNPAGAGQLTERAGDILDRLDRDGQAAQRYRAAADGYRQAGLAVDEARASRRYATSLLWSGDASGSVAALAAADELAARLPDGGRTDWERALLGYDGARVLGRTGRLTEALARIGGAVAEFERLAAPVQAAHAEALRGQLLLQSGDADGAVQSASRALAVLPAEAGGRQGIARLLAEALDARGQPEDADRVRREHDLPTGAA